MSNKFKFMGILQYFKNSFARKKARRVFQKYGYRVDVYSLEKEGNVEFANWLNPLINPYKLLQQEFDFFKEIIKPGSLAIDIGAHIGSLTVPIGFAAGKDGMVLAFEPNPQSFEGLTKNAALNKNRSNIVPLQLAAANKDGEFFYASSEASFSNGGLLEQKDDNRLGKHKLAEPVKSVSLNNFLKNNYQEWLPKLSFIKVDAEGFDLLILKDIKPIIETYRPTVVAEIFFSTHRSLTKEEREEIFTLFSEYNYSMYNVGHFEINENSGTIEKIAVRSKEQMPYNKTYNILAIPN